MDHSLLRSWLRLDPGPWPPDHYTLLGLPPGACDPAAVESLVLERMGRLREHQLLHPELVTEGMNRLAQALICLTDPAARAAYDEGLGLAAGGPPDPDLLLDRPPAGGPGPPPYELVEEDRPEPLPLPPAYEVVREPGPPPRPAYEVVETVTPRPAGPRQPATRRELFARIAAARRLLAVWRKLEPVLGDPREPLSRPVRVVAFLEAVAELGPALGPLRDVVGEPGRPGALVVALLARPLILPTFRLLLPDQRRAVAVDWRRGESALTTESARLRGLVRSGRPVRRRWRCRRTVWLIRTPEIVLAVLAAVAVLAVVLRSGGRW